MNQAAGRAVVTVDLDAVRHNLDVVSRAVHPAGYWAVVKADGYGHGAVAVSRVAIDHGAVGLCVALNQEGIELRDAGVSAPILVLSEQPVDQAPLQVAAGLTPTLYRRDSIDAFADVAPRGTAVHIKVDTGMHRVGAAPHDLADLVSLARRRGLDVAGVFTHLAVADEPGHAYNSEQLDAFDSVTAGLDVVRHAANSAAALTIERARYDNVRVGIAMYGLCPGPAVTPWCTELLPALQLSARVGFVKRLRAGDRLSYGLRHRCEHDTNVVTLPIGYADGFRRLFGNGQGAALIGGRRWPVVGSVTMDQIMVDVGDADVQIADEAVLIGQQGTQTITADDWATTLGTINYEVTCALTARLPRRYLGSTP